MLRRLADRLWTHTLWGRAQAEHQYVLARLKAYCGEDGNASTTLNSAASALAEWAEHRWRWQVAEEHARGSTQADAGRYVCTECGANDRNTDSLVLATCPRNTPR